jgi:hypothetical protein
MWARIYAFFHKSKRILLMDTTAVFILLLVIVVVFTGLFFLWLYVGWAHRKISPSQPARQKEVSLPQISSDSRVLNSPQGLSDFRALNSPQGLSDFRALNSYEGWQGSRTNFDPPSLPSQVPLEHFNPNQSRPGWSSSLDNSRYTGENLQIIPSGTRSIEHYEQRIHVSYEPRIDGISLVFTDTYITNKAEVDNVFTVCERKFREVMRVRGWERVGWIGDLGDYNLVGTEATRLVGETLKLFLDKFGLKTQGGLYLISHYSSKATPPDQEALKEKLKRIQFMTAGVINKFHGHVFDTREEAIAFYLRLREDLLAGR